MTLNTDMAAYYAQRAQTWEDVYAKPECQQELSVVHDWISKTLAGHKVMELACGTGYWTDVISQTAQSVLASDVNPAMLALALAKKSVGENVQFAITDAYSVQVTEPFTACFSGFWWSHVAREQQDGLLRRLREQFGKDTLLVLIDDCYVEATSTVIARTDLLGNTFQIHTMETGERFEIIKNFPTDSGLRKRLGPHLKELRITRLEHYWMLSGRLK